MERSNRNGRALRAAAWATVAIGFATPLVRRRLRLRPPVVFAVAAAAPVALAIATHRSRKRDVAVYALQMWAYVATYQMPYDSPEKLIRRLKVDYPITVDRLLGGGELPTMRLQRWLGRPDRIRPLDKLLVWVHWTWFATPHLAAVYIMFVRPERFGRAAFMICSVFDLGLIGYWAAPTAPPWWASDAGRMPKVRRIMAEAGEQFWGRAWRPLYGFFGGNPLAAMPSLHFATSVMAAHMLAETGAGAGAVGWAYALTLGFGLVYLGEHYVIDVLAGLALTEAIRLAAPHFVPLLERAARAVEALQAKANPTVLELTAPRLQARLGSGRPRAPGPDGRIGAAVTERTQRILPRSQ